MIRRSRRTLPATLVALVLLGGCVAVIVSLVQRLRDTGEYISYNTVARYVHETAWSDLPVLFAALAAVVIGVLLVAAAVFPGRARVLPLTAEDPAGDLDAGVRRGDLAAMLRGAATRVDGVESARIRIRRDTVTVTARTDRHNQDGMAEEVCAALRARIQQVGRPVRRVRTELHGPKSPTVKRGRRADAPARGSHASMARAGQRQAEDLPATGAAPRPGTGGR
ncbi:DUF6286 domain-containing protein [Nocardia sp. NBC_00416]|uniref:DUF6286 domain-containing protein n=1 Tax=Nocardia sp. NBC_00416 TaxID=2975991 RepID=UPI002E1F39AA